MNFEEIRRAAQEKARANPASRAELEPLRDQAQAFFGQIPEPPLYRRSNDPSRKEAEKRLGEAVALLARAYALVDAGQGEAKVLAETLEAHAEALNDTVEGDLEEAEAAWSRAVGLERRALASRRAYVRSDEELPNVFDRGSGQSRYDPRPDAQIRVKLACPQKSCHTVAEYAFSPAHASHPFECGTCHAPFLAFFGEAKEGEVQQVGRGRHYRFTLEELGGGRSRVEFDEPTGADFHVARRDLLAFLYTENRELRGVLNLSSSRLMWISKSGCFVATAAFGEGAQELDAFRAFRDRVLLPRAGGRLFVAGYYALGPSAASFVRRSPWLRRRVRAGLARVHRWLVRQGFGQAGEQAARDATKASLASVGPTADSWRP